MATETQRLARKFATGERINFGKLKFPEYYEEESGGHWLTLTEYEYKRPSMDASFEPVPTGNFLSLPVPLNLNPTYQLNWGMQEQGAFGNVAGGEIAKLATFIQQNGFGSMVDYAKSGAGADTLKNLGSAVATDIISNNRLAQNVGIVTGFARNPFLAANFEGVLFRNFNFDYKLYPKSKSESDIIENIFKMLKYGAHPSYQDIGSLKNALFKYPNIYLPAFSKPEYLFDFGFCVISQISINYHNENGPIYYDEDGKKIPAFVNLNFELREIEIITKESLAGSTKSGNVIRGR